MSGGQVSETSGIGEGQPKQAKNTGTTPQSTTQVRNAIQTAIAHWKSQGVQDWEILDIWANLAYQQGNYAVADSLESAAYELGKPIE
jgi:hypothetical protein